MYQTTGQGLNVFSSIPPDGQNPFEVFFLVVHGQTSTTFSMTGCLVSSFDAIDTGSPNTKYQIRNNSNCQQFEKCIRTEQLKIKIMFVLHSKDSNDPKPLDLETVHLLSSLYSNHYNNPTS